LDFQQTHSDDTHPTRDEFVFQSTATLLHWLLLATIVGLTLITDHITKRIVVNSLSYGESWTPFAFLDGIFDITYTRNTGAAFGMGQRFSNVFLIIAVIVVVAIIYYYRHLPEGTWLVRLALGLQMGGALGNALDRIFRGYVVDFFHVHGFPIFNIADSSIVVGTVILVAVLWWEDRQHSEESENSSESVTETEMSADSHG
jgi:signal peptidase II